MNLLIVLLALKNKNDAFFIKLLINLKKIKPHSIFF